MRYLVLFFMIMGLRGGLFAQAATPIYSITRGAMQAYVTHDTMVYPLGKVDTINCCPAYVIGQAIGNWADQKVTRMIEIPFGDADVPAIQSIGPVIPKNALEFNTNAVPFRWGLGFISGAARGLNQTIAFHPDRFFARYPDANRRYWDNSISWQNKWRNGDPQQGEAFPGSSTVFVWTTDALHLSGTISNVTGVASLSIPLYKGCGKMNLWRHLAQVGITSAGYWLGFHSVYSWWF